MAYKSRRPNTHAPLSAHCLLPRDLILSLPAGNQPYTNTLPLILRCTMRSIESNHLDFSTQRVTSESPSDELVNQWLPATFARNPMSDELNLPKLKRSKPVSDRWKASEIREFGGFIVANSISRRAPQRRQRDQQTYAFVQKQLAIYFGVTCTLH